MGASRLLHRISLIFLTFLSLTACADAQPFYRRSIQAESLKVDVAIGGRYNTETITIADSVINCKLSNSFQKTLSANQRFVLNEMPDGQTVNIAITNTASNYTVTWVTAITWKDNNVPTQTVGAKTDIYSFIKFGSTIFGSVSQTYY